MSQAHVAIKAGGDLAVYGASWERHLKAEGKSPRTIISYLAAVAALSGYLARTGMPMAVASISGEHVREFLTDQLAHHKRSTVAAHYRGLRVFFNWLVAEGEIQASPLARIKAPKIPDDPPRVLTEEELRRLLAVSERGDSFTGRRDAAIVRMFIDTGLRLSELANLRWLPDSPKENDVDFEQALLRVTGKGNKERIVHVGAKTLRALDRYLRRRHTHKHAGLPWLWLAPQGRLTARGVQEMVVRKGRDAGITGLHPHVLRHVAAHYWLAGGGQEGDLMRHMGWSSRQMVSRYGASAAQERSWAAHAKFGLGDRL